MYIYIHIESFIDVFSMAFNSYHHLKYMSLIIRNTRIYVHGGFLEWEYPQIILNWTILVLKPMVSHGNLGIPHFKKPPYIHRLWLIDG